MSSNQKLATMADVFLDSANVLLETDKMKFCFVILYMLGTAVELYLKAIITINGEELQFTHDLSGLAKLANINAPGFLKTLTHYLCWKSKYHEARYSKFEKSFYEQDDVAVNYDEIISYIQELKNNYLKY